MAKNTKNLPYFKIRQSLEEKILADFLIRKFRPRIKKKFPQHFLVQPIPFKTLNFIKETSKKYPYFLRFDIRLYYPSIEHKILLKILSEISNNLCGNISRRLKKISKKDLPEFLSRSPYDKGLPIGSALSYALAGIFLLAMDLKIKNPFLRQADDYLIFCKRRREPEFLLKNIILPKLKDLNLEINEKKLSSGKFHQDKVSFIGFNFFAGYFTIREEKIEEFKRKISKLTHLRKKKSKKAVIKSLNNQILGFGHYYKFASSKRTFEELNGFIRQRFRRWLSRNKDQKQKTANLFLTNRTLKNLGLKLLLGIKENYASKRKRIFLKNTPKIKKASQFRKGLNSTQFEEIEFKYQQKLVLNRLKELTSSVKKLEKEIRKINKKLE